jgi:uncharacterized protein DUF6429
LRIEYDSDKVDEVTLALLWLTHFSDSGTTRSWKGYDWDAMDRLYERDYISDPKSKAESVCLTADGEKHANELFAEYFSPMR